MSQLFKNIFSCLKKKKKKDIQTYQEEYFNSADYIISATIFHCKNNESHTTTIPILSSQ